MSTRQTLPSHWTRIMWTLLLKDARLFRMPLIALLSVTAGCYVISLVAHYFLESRDIVFESIALLNLKITGVLGAAFGGVAIAGERNERTCDFVALLPVSRFQFICSKWLSAGLMMIPFLVLNSAVVICLPSEVTTRPGLNGLIDQHITSVIDWTCVAVSFFGVAWLFGSFLKSPAISASAAIFIVLFSIILLTTDHLDRLHGSDRDFEFIQLGIGVFSAIGGSVYYLWRLAP